MWRQRTECLHHPVRQEVKAQPMQSLTHSAAWREYSTNNRTKHSVLQIYRPFDAYLSKIFNDSRFLHLPVQRKALKSLTWDICFLELPVIFHQDICLTTCISQPKKFYIYWPLAYVFEGGSPYLLRGCFLGSRSQ